MEKKNPSPKNPSLPEVFKEDQIIRARDAGDHGISRTELGRLVRSHRITRVGRGLYAAANHEPTEHNSLVQAQKRVPDGIICLLSALRFHELTTQAPFEVWMAIATRARKPSIDYPPMRFVRFSGRALTHGVEEHPVEGVDLRVTSPARTVADCFKYRNKIGMDVAMEALRDYLRVRRGTVDDLWRSAEVCRVTKIIRPYLEALV